MGVWQGRTRQEAIAQDRQVAMVAARLAQTTVICPDSRTARPLRIITTTTNTTSLTTAKAFPNLHNSSVSTHKLDLRLLAARSLPLPPMVPIPHRR